jgi:uncharacterized membrane protein YfcA
MICFVIINVIFNRSYFLNHLATCLVGGNKSQKFHILTGSGSNGKSMLMNLTSKALGDYAAVVPITLFTQKRAGSGSAANFLNDVIRFDWALFILLFELIGIYIGVQLAHRVSLDKLRKIAAFLCIAVGLYMSSFLI